MTAYSGVSRQSGFAFGDYFAHLFAVIAVVK